MDRKFRAKSDASLANADALAESGVYEMDPFGPEAETVLKVKHILAVSGLIWLQVGSPVWHIA